MLVMGVACLASAFAADLNQLVVWRFVTGLGLGAAMPNAVTLMSEYCPDGRRAMLTNAMFCGFPLGAAFGGFLAAWMIPLWGWRSVLVLGGSGAAGPDAAAGRAAAGIGALHGRQGAAGRSASAPCCAASRPRPPRPRRFVLTEKAPAQPAGSGIDVVLSSSYRVGSVMLWLAYFMGLVIFYALINWMPLLFKDVGLEPHTAALISALFPLGGVGAILFGWLMDRFNANLIIAAASR